MTKIFYLQHSKLGNWSLSKDVKHAEHFFERVGVKRTKSIFNAKFIFSPWYNVFLNSLVYYNFILLLKKISKVSLIIVVSNDITEIEKEKLTKLKNIVDKWVVPSDRVFNFLVGHVDKESIFKIPFYVPSDKFYDLSIPRKELSIKLDIDYEIIKDKILIGTFQRDSLGSDLSKAKWQKNPQMIVNICKQLSRDRFVLVLAGPRRHFLVEQCKINNIPYIYIGNYKFISEMKDDIVENNLKENVINQLYNLIDIYIVGSKSEGGPKAIIEAVLSKTLIASTNVGFAGEYLHKELIYREDNLSRVVDLVNNSHKAENEEKFIEYNYKKVREVYNKSEFEKMFKSLV
jgi:hypothetical protein